MKLPSLSLGLALLLAPALATADYYTYTTESGTVAFTDELKRVPTRYREQAERREHRSLASYPRLTVVPRGATSAPSPELLEIPADEEPVPAEVTYTPHGVTIDAGAGVLVDVPNAGRGPVKVSRRVVWQDGVATRQLVVRQGGATLAVIDQQVYQAE